MPDYTREMHLRGELGRLRSDIEVLYRKVDDTPVRVDEAEYEASHLDTITAVAKKRPPTPQERQRAVRAIQCARLSKYYYLQMIRDRRDRMMMIWSELGRR